MSIVTTLKPQKKQNRVNVYLDGEFGFGIDLDNLVILKIKVGNEYSEDEIQALIKKAQYQKVLDKLLRFATMRPRSEKEFDIWLTKKEVHESLWSELKDRLTHFELLDDFKFAKWWVNQRLNFRPKSQRALKFELKTKGVDQGVVNKIFENSQIDEVQMAKDLISKRSYRWARFEPKIRKQKISQYLGSKGFTWEVIQKVV